MRPLFYASAVLAVFLTAVIVLAVKAGTSAAMLTTLFIIVLAATACGLWGTAMAVRDTDDHTRPREASFDEEHLVKPGTRTH